LAFFFLALLLVFLTSTAFFVFFLSLAVALETFLVFLQLLEEEVSSLSESLSDSVEDLGRRGQAAGDPKIGVFTHQKI